MFGQVDIAWDTSLEPCHLFRKSKDGVARPLVAQGYQEKDDDTEADVAGND